MAQTRQPNEIVIVDAFSDDGTAEMLFGWAQNDSRVNVIQEKGNAARGRNTAIREARYDHILSTDMGVRLATVWCEELARPFDNDPDVKIVAGNTRIDQETVRSAVARAEYFIENGGQIELHPGFVPGNRSVAYAKEVWQELGGLPEDLSFYADDSVFGRQMIQADYRMAFAPRAMTYWGRPNRFRDFWKEQFNYGCGDGEALIKTPVAYRLYAKGLLPAFLVPLATSLRILVKRLTLSAFLRALAHKDLLACLCMPPLLAGNGYCFGKGYLAGSLRGDVECTECRKRLQFTSREDSNPV